MLEPIITESLTLVTLLLYAIDWVNIQSIFDRDPYESRRHELKGSRLVKVLVFYQLIKDPTQRGLLRALDQLPDTQAALGGTLKRNTLSNALVQRDLDQIIEAWIVLLAHYRPYLEQTGKKFARIAAVDASLIKLSLAAYDWAKYRKQTGAAKVTCVFDWVKGVPQQFVFTASGKIHDLKATTEIAWCAGWTYLFDRGYFAFDLLTALLNIGAHFVLRFKDGVDFKIIERRLIPEFKLPAGIRAITSDWTVILPGWDGDIILRLVSYRLTDGKSIRVLTDRHDLSALSVALLYKERWTIENWWRWLKRVYKIKEPLGRSENALPLQIVAAFVTDLLLRAFKHCGGFKGKLYEFVTTCRDLALVPIARLGSLREVLLAATRFLELPQFLPQT
ncbi:MAG TPA: IS4 family transposase [Candidatus Caenarcaniphilales bacterium]